MSNYHFKPPLIAQDRLERYSFFIFKHNFFQNSFFPSVIIKWNNLFKIQKVWIHLKKSILKFIRPSSNSTNNCFNTNGIKHLTRLHLGLSHLRYYKFKHGFLDSINPICSWGFDIETTVMFYSIVPMVHFYSIITYAINNNLIKL